MSFLFPKPVRAAATAAFVALGVWPAGFSRAAGDFSAAEFAGFIDQHCATCHNDVDKEGGLDLTALTWNPGDPANFLTWIKVHDLAQAGEMPPKEKRRPRAADLKAFVDGISQQLVAVERQAAAKEGRAKERRLNRYEYENALRDLFQAPWLQIKGKLPEDGSVLRFNRLAAALDVSHVHLARYMTAADYAIRQAMSVQLDRPPTRVTRFYARDEPTLTNRFELRRAQTYPDRLTFPVLRGQAQPEVRARTAPLTVGEADPQTRNEEAIGMVSSTFGDASSYSWSQFRAPVAGRYKLRIAGYSLWVAPGASRRIWFGTGDNIRIEDQPIQWHRPNVDQSDYGHRNEPMGAYASSSGLRRRLGAFEFKPQPSVSELEVTLIANEVIQTDASRLFRNRSTGDIVGYTNPLAQRDGIPGVAVQWMEVEGPLYDRETGAGYRLLFGDLPLRKVEGRGPGLKIEVPAPAGRGRGARGGPGGGGRGAAEPPATVTVEVASANPAQDAERLIRAFMNRAYRRPVEETEVQHVFGLFQGQMSRGFTFTEAMVAAYTAVLASPGFVFVEAQPGRLDDYALATRLALFLTNSEPDQALRALAARGELRKPEVLRAQTDRLLDDPRSSRFVEAFLDYWLDLKNFYDTAPSNTLYNDYALDDWLEDSALDETRMFFAELLRGDLPARNIVQSDFVFVNEKLASHYGIPGVEGPALRKVSVPANSPRGGLLTQASVLKVTANGTTTSPVMRGVWIMERILGYETHPPPSVPAVEPDIRGATTIREQLDKHRADEACASCHSKIDPPGFALESFDVMGGWRDRYRAVSPDVPPEKGSGKNGHSFVFHYAMPVDASGELPGGRKFRDVREFKQLLLQDEAKIARNLVRQLSIYATGSPVRFSNRADVERILEAAQASHYGVRSLVHGIVQSELFRNK